MLVCEGSVTTLWACAAVNTRPPAASRSSSGVGDGRRPPNPGASARSVSMVTSTRARGGAGAGAPAPAERPAAAAAIATAIAATATKAARPTSRAGRAAVRRPVEELMTGEAKTRRARGSPGLALPNASAMGGLAEVQRRADAEDPRREHLEDVLGGGGRGGALQLKHGVLVQQVEAVDTDRQAEVVEGELLGDPPA